MLLVPVDSVLDDPKEIELPFQQNQLLHQQQLQLGRY
jgi:hypothetical protein